MKMTVGHVNMRCWMVSFICIYLCMLAKERRLSLLTHTWRRVLLCYSCNSLSSLNFFVILGGVKFTYVALSTRSNYTYPVASGTHLKPPLEVNLTCYLYGSSYYNEYIYIYIYAFSRRFYPKRLTLHSSYSFYILSALAFPGNRTHDLGVASAMLYQLSYRKAVVVKVRHSKKTFVLITSILMNKTCMVLFGM